MARPPLPIGTWGTVKLSTTKAGTPLASARYRAFDGKTSVIKRTGPTPAKARIALLEHLAEISRTDDTLLADTRLHRVIQQWWEEYLETSEPPIGTERRYRNVIDGHIIPGLGQLTLRETRTPRLNLFLRDLTKSTSYATSGVARAILSNIMNYAVRMGAITTNPVAGCAPIKKPATEPTAWSIDEIAEMRVKLREWDAGKDKRGKRVSDLAGPSDFMLGTGCRPGETFAVKWDDIDFDSTPPTVRIHATVVKDRNHKPAIQEMTKGKRARTLALPPFLVAQLLERRMTSLTDLVFPSSTGTIRLPDNYRTSWKNALGANDTFDRLPKMYRSSVASFIAVEAGVDAARGQLGHSSVAITEKHYLADGDVGPDVSKLLEQFGNKRT